MIIDISYETFLEAYVDNGIGTQKISKAMKSLLTTKVKGGVRGLLFQNTFDGVGSDSCRERAVLGLGVSTLEVPGILVELADS